MKKWLALVIVLVAFSFYMIGANNFYVENGESIQNAINNASNGDTICVHGYHHENITVNKSINIIGIKNESIIDGFIEISGSNVSIINITTNRIIMEGRNCTIKGNEISRGEILINGSNNTIYQNLISNCSKAIDLKGDNNTIYQNEFSLNGYGIYSEGNGNVIFHNNFINNTINAYDNGSNLWDNGSVGNYWSDYNGSDNNSDGIGDMPYEINKSARDNYPLMNPYDVYPPITTCQINGNAGNNGWYVGNVTISFLSNDQSGVAYTKYQINGGGWQDYNYFIPINISYDGIYSINFYSVDNKGNEEAIKETEIKIDSTPPSISYNIYPLSPDGKNGWYVSNVEISLSANDENLESIYYKIDNDTWHPYEGDIIIPDGIHVIYFKAVDEAGNYAISNTTIKKDTSPPEIDIEKPDGGIVKRNYKIEYNASDVIDKNLSGNISIYYSPDNGTTWKEIAIRLNNTGEYNWNTFYFNDSSQAMIKIVAVDDAGNIGTKISNPFILDNTPPTVIVTHPQTGEAFGKDKNGNINIDVFWEANDAIDNNLDGSISILYYFNQTWHTIVDGTDNDGEYSINAWNWSDGTYKIKVVAVDDAGNVGAGESGNFTIDKTPPSVYISKPLKGYVYINLLGRAMLPPLPLIGLPYDAVVVGKIIIQVEASDEYSGVQEVIISSDGMNFPPLYKKPYQVEWNPSIGVHSLNATAYDKAGNMASYGLGKILCINV